MAASWNNCIQAPYATGCSIQITCSNGTWQEFDYAEAMQLISVIDDAIPFLTKNNFVAGPSNPLMILLHGLSM